MYVISKWDEFPILLCYVCLLQAITFLAVFIFEPQGQTEGYDAEQGKDKHGNGIVIEKYLIAVAHNSAYYAVLAQYVANEQGYTAKTYVLYPEDECVGRAQKAQGDNLGH